MNITSEHSKSAGKYLEMAAAATFALNEYHISGYRQKFLESHRAVRRLMRTGRCERPGRRNRTRQFRICPYYTLGFVSLPWIFSLESMSTSSVGRDEACSRSGWKLGCRSTTCLPEGLYNGPGDQWSTLGARSTSRCQARTAEFVLV